MGSDDDTKAPRDVLDFWFGTLDSNGLAAPEKRARWFDKNAAFDDMCRTRFKALYDEVTAHAHDDWLEQPRSALAYIIVLDQFSRNMFRGEPAMFAFDELAVDATLSAVRKRFDAELEVEETVFLYMPLMHSEDIRHQDRCVKLFQALHDSLDGPAKERVTENLSYARQHREVIERFGRFPHRNAILGRRSTPEEVAFLEQPGSSF